MASHRLSASPKQPPFSHSDSQVTDGDNADVGGLDLGLALVRLKKGMLQVTGLGLLGLFLGVSWTLVDSVLTPKSVTTRIVFSFPGFERGEYPDHSKFQPDDIRGPSVIDDAITKLGMSRSSDFEAKVRGAISIEANIPANITRERDKLRASGQMPPAYVPNEYELTFTLRNLKMGGEDRKQLLNQIVSSYSSQFQRTYSKLPERFGNAFTTLESADYPEYQLVLDKEIENITAYLNDQISDARTFRSRRTNLAFNDLLEQTQVFAQIRLNETLGIIHQNGLSRDRRTAMVKMDYYIRILEDQERRAVEEANVVDDLLKRSQTRTQGYVLGIKSQTEKDRSDAQVVDQGLINTLLQNDSYNFLVHRSLDVSFKVKQIQADKSRLVALRDNMKTFMNRDPGDQSAILTQVEKSLRDLQSSYQKLTQNIRETYEDFAAQQYGDAIRVSENLGYPTWLKSVTAYCFFGVLAGISLGAGLSILGIYVRPRPNSIVVSY